MTLKQEIIKLFEDGLTSLTWLLVVSYLCSFLATYFWAFDLFSHFLMQYCFVGLLFGASFVALKQHKRAALVFLIAALSLFESRMSLQHPMQIFPPAKTGIQTIRLVQYNHHVSKQNFEGVKLWLTKNADTFDIIVLQEATAKTVELMGAIKNLYPYQIHEPRSNAFGMVVLSRYPITEHSIINLTGNVVDNFFIRATINVPETNEPLIIYALHAIPPTGHRLFQQRNSEILEVGQIVSEDTHRYKAMIGDWNITPYSPFFTKLLDKSGLNYQAKGLLLNPSWPCVPIYYFMKIPIDHILYSDSLQFVDKEVMSNFRSDHNAIVTTLGFLEQAEK
jgi:endonuclease/exonuclease/phosphatase (EEP) superfamily protein YafD